MSTDQRSAAGASRLVTIAATAALTLAIAAGAAWKLGWVRPPGGGRRSRASAAPAAASCSSTATR